MGRPPLGLVSMALVHQRKVSATTLIIKIYSAKVLNFNFIMTLTLNGLRRKLCIHQHQAHNECNKRSYWQAVRWGSAEFTRRRNYILPSSTGQSNCYSSLRWQFLDEHLQHFAVPAYAVVGLRANYEVTRNAIVYASAVNLFNRQYITFGTGSNNTSYVLGMPQSINVGARIIY